ncbi:Hypothetical protein CINCED_3A023807 [Cinara cedri]|uniref:Uncharacterized protein n=1 Tax=Cinara cedri TaxID=506608 RepID=A0A5E4MB97_9HEMI|nr:Hypothetical protein CINCED_3A023807 [Cinara cedri]
MKDLLEKLITDCVELLRIYPFMKKPLDTSLTDTDIATPCLLLLTNNLNPIYHAPVNLHMGIMRNYRYIKNDGPDGVSYYYHDLRKNERIILRRQMVGGNDGPDGVSYYYHDLRKNERIILRRQMVGGSVTIWCSIGYKGRSEGLLAKEVYKDAKHYSSVRGWKQSILDA